MRDIIRRIWRWVFGPRYYTVQVAYHPGGIGYTAYSRSEDFGACYWTGVFDDYDKALSYWRSRALDTKDPGMTYTIVDVTGWEDTLEEYFHYNPGKAPCR